MKSVLGGIGDAFEDRNFRFYSVGSIISWLSYYIQAVAVSWEAWELTHSTQWLAIVALADAIPNIVLMPIGGVIADRTDRFRLLITSYVAATLQAALLAGAAFSGHLTIGVLTALAFLHGAIHAFSIPAAFGFLPRFIVKAKLPSAIAVASAYAQLGAFIGPALAGWLIQHQGTSVVFALNVAGYGIYFASVACLRTPADYVPQAPSGKSFRMDFLDGIRAIASHRGIRAILLIMLIGSVLDAAIRQMAPAFVQDVLGGGVEGLSALLSCAGIGATLGGLWLAHGGARRSTPATILLSYFGFLLFVIGLMLSRSIVEAGVAMIGLGASVEISRIATLSLMQTSVPDAVRARVLSARFLLNRLAGSLGIAVVGLTADQLGLRIPILVMAIAGLAIWAMTYLRRARIFAAFSTATN